MLMENEDGLNANYAKRNLIQTIPLLNFAQRNVGLKVEKPDQLVPALEEAKKSNADGKTVLIDVKSNLEERRSCLSR